MATIADGLGRFRVGFFVEHRGSVARPGLYDLLGTLARAVPLVATDDPSVPVHPVWSGIVLSWGDALRRFGCPEVEGFVVGSATAAQRDTFIDAVLRRPPLGLVGIERDGSKQGLPLTQWLVPSAVIARGEIGRKFDPMMGVDVLGFRDEFDEIWPFPLCEPDDDDHLSNGLLRQLALSVSRNFRGVRTTSRHADLVAHASELLDLGAVSAAGAVAGAAFERLVKRAAVGELRDRIDAGAYVTLHSVIEAVAPPSGDHRLMAFKDLRNDIAHRLGDHSDPAQHRTDEALYDGVAGLIAFLARQKGDADQVVLADADPRPEISPEHLHRKAFHAGEIAATEARPIAMQVGREVIADGVFGASAVVVRDRRLAFTGWLGASGTGDPDPEADVVRLESPHRHLERALAWAWGYCELLLANDVPCGYIGRLD